MLSLEQNVAIVILGPLLGASLGALLGWFQGHVWVCRLDCWNVGTLECQNVGMSEFVILAVAIAWSVAGCNSGADALGLLLGAVQGTHLGAVAGMHLGALLGLSWPFHQNVMMSEWLKNCVLQLKAFIPHQPRAMRHCATHWCVAKNKGCLLVVSDV